MTFMIGLLLMIGKMSSRIDVHVNSGLYADGPPSQGQHPGGRCEMNKKNGRAFLTL
jgi:hypothetical protein